MPDRVRLDAAHLPGSACKLSLLLKGPSHRPRAQLATQELMHGLAGLTCVCLSWLQAEASLTEVRG